MGSFQPSLQVLPCFAHTAIIICGHQRLITTETAQTTTDPRIEWLESCWNTV